MISIALDGPAGAGKSTIAKFISKSLGYIYVDTGALYRTVALKFVKSGVAPHSGDAVTKLLASTDIKLAFINGEQHVMLDKTDVTDELRSPETSMMASTVSALPPVRAFLLETQRSIAEQNNIVMDGRDIGTVVLPNADIKIFLTASAEERATRRFNELIEKGISVTYEDVLSDMQKRDYNDTHRDIAPLKQADDAVLVDTTGKTLEQSVALISEIINKKLADK